MSEKPAKVLALLPAYNEHVHIAAVINGAKKYLPVVVVDDGSRIPVHRPCVKPDAPSGRMPPRRRPCHFSPGRGQVQSEMAAVAAAAARKPAIR